MKIPNEITFTTSTISDGNMSPQFGDDAKSKQSKFVGHEDYVAMACTHGDVIKIVDSSEVKNPNAEVLVTQKTNLTLLLLTADCLPTAFYDPITKTIALAHMSRATIAAGLPEETINWLQQECKVNPINLQILAGPYIHKESYGFPLPLDNEPSSRIAPFTSKVNNHVYIDLAAACRSQLVESGVLEENVQLSDVDTYTSPNHFSHFESTRDNSKPHGRMATILSLIV